MKAKFIFSLAFFCTAKLLSQDIDYISPTTNWLQLNPAYAGSNGGFRSQVNYCQNSYQRYDMQSGFSNDLYLKKIKSGISLSLNRTGVGHGIVVEDAFSMGYSKQINLKKLDIIGGIEAKAVQKNIDLNALNCGDIIDPRWHESYYVVLPNSRNNVLDLNIGTLLDLRNGLVIGVSAKHINQPDIGSVGVLRLPARYLLHASYDKVLGGTNLVNIQFYLSEQGGTEQAKLQTLVVLKKHLYTGFGAGISNNYSSGSINFGYKANFWTASVFFGTQYYPETKSLVSSSQLSVSANIRDKEHRKSLSALHTW